MNWPNKPFHLTPALAPTVARPAARERPALESTAEETLIVHSEPRRRRPKLVWVVFLWYLLSGGYTLLSFALIYSGIVSLRAEAAAYLTSLSPLDQAATVLLLLLNLGGAVALLLLRKVAFQLFAVALTLSLVLTIIHTFAKGLVPALGGGGTVGLVLGYGVGILVCVYSWRLRARGALA